MNTLGGAGAAYLVRGDARYLDILRNAYDYLQAHQVFATGGYGPDEQLLPREALLAQAVEDRRPPPRSNAAPGPRSRWSSICMRCTGDARYGDWAERLAINGHRREHPDDRRRPRVLLLRTTTRTAADKRSTAADGWSCCTGTRIQATADFCDLIYFKDKDNLCVNLFTPSTVKWSHAGANVTLHQTTRFPEDGTVEFTVETDRPVEAGLKIRTPLWLAAPMTAKLNGEPVSLEADALHWSSLRREWKTGDRLDDHAADAALGEPT